MKQSVKNFYPLEWPTIYGRTEAKRRKKSSFIQGMDKTQRFLQAELRRMNATDVSVTANIPVRADGYYFSDWMRRNIEDPGVAVYFTYNSKQVALACDQYLQIWENMYAIAKSIEAIRGMERWGVSEIVDRAFTGFMQLPAPTMESIWNILGIEKMPDLAIEIHEAYKRQAKKMHPDVGGKTEDFQKLRQAYDSALNLYHDAK